ncbi:MAG: hypothetical protein PWP46_1976 [Fusobacteriaceae bacterium]|nr:hypothetical protein [Fusobacteriaceae bacterium]
MESYSYLPIFNTNKTEVQFYLSSPLKTKELNLLNYIFKHYNTLKNKEITIDRKTFFEKTKLTDSSDIEKFLYTLANKKVICRFSNNTTSFFNIFEHISILKDIILFYLSNEFILSFEKNNFFSDYNLKDIIRLKNKNSIIFYNNIFDKLIHYKKFKIQLEEFKALFNLSNENYSRFFDMERFLLKPILKDIKKLGNYNIIYNKIKSGNNKTNKIIGIEFELITHFNESSDSSLNSLIKYIKKDINDFNKIFKTLIEYKDIYGYEYIYDNIVFAKQNPHKNFEEFLVKSLKENYAIKSYDDIYGVKNMIFKLEKNFTLSDFQNLIHYTMQDIDLYYSFNIKFLKQIKQIKNKNWIYYEDNHYIVLGAFFISKKSYIRIYKV